MRRRVRRSAQLDPVKLLLRELEHREAPSESLSFLSGQMFYGVAALAAQPPARVAPPVTAAKPAAAGDGPIISGIFAADPVAARPRPTRPGRAPRNMLHRRTGRRPRTAWADPWAGWVDGAFPNDGIRPAPVAPPADDAGAGKGGGGEHRPELPPGPTSPATPAGATGMAAVAGQDAGVAPVGAATPTATAAKGSKGAGSPAGTGSPFPWAQPPAGSGGLIRSAVVYGSGTTVFTPATLTHPSYVVDANKGAVLSEAVINNDFSKFAVDLRAQVSGATVGTYTWDTSGASDATSVSGGEHVPIAVHLGHVHRRRPDRGDHPDRGLRRRRQPVPDVPLPA